MKLIKPYYKILTPINGEEILKQIELAARTCYQSEGKIEYGKYYPKVREEDEHVPPMIEDGYAVSARKLIPKLIDNHHEAMLEFGGMITVRFIVDRGVTHELVRHRLCSFAQESTRYCNYNKDKHVTYIIPHWLTLKEGEYVYTESESALYYFNTDLLKYVKLILPEDTEKWLQVIENTEHQYNLLVGEFKWTPQQARSVLPNSLKSEINISANIREWRHIFKLRTAKTAHPQMREIMCPLLDEFKSKIPILFDDINY